MSQGLQWVRLDTALPDHPKMIELYESGDYRAAMLYVWGLCYAGRQSTAGYLPRRIVTTRLEGRVKDAERLVKVGLWTDAVGGWDINGWDEYQVSDESAVKRKERAQKAAAARWASKSSHDGKAG